MPDNLEEISVRLESESSRDRMLALAALREVPATDAVPLIKRFWTMRTSKFARWLCLLWV